MEFKVSKERMMELAAAELRDSVANSSGTTYHQVLLDKGPDAIFSFYKEGRGFAELPDFNSELARQVTPNIHRRMEKLKSSFGEGVLRKIFRMDSQNCYSLFGCSNDDLEGLEWISSLIINGLYDDASLGIRKNSMGLWNISYISDDDSDRLSQEDVLEIIQRKEELHEYYKVHEVIIDRGRNLGYLRMHRDYEEFFRTFMRKEDRDALYEEERKRFKRAEERLNGRF